MNKTNQSNQIDKILKQDQKIIGEAWLLFKGMALKQDNSFAAWRDFLDAIDKTHTPYKGTVREDFSRDILVAIQGEIARIQKECGQNNK